MRGRRYLMLVMAGVLVWWAVRLMPSAFALTSATVNFTGSVQAGGTAFVTCGTSNANLTPRFLQRSSSASGTVQVTCINNMNIPVVVNLSSGTLTPAGGATPPSRTWSPSSIALGASGTGSSTLTVKVNPNVPQASYSLSFTTTVTASNGLDYTKSHTVGFIVF